MYLTCTRRSPRCAWLLLAQIQGKDLLSGKIIRLFHPRRQQWQDHFQWSADGTEILGLTACGRATVTALQLNRPELIGARSLWVQVGWWPPAEDQKGLK